MRLIGNIIWLVLCGIWLAIAYVVAGIVNCIFIITIPFGIQAFKLAGLVLWPFGKVVIVRQDRDAALGCLGNGIWFITAGLWLALGHLLAGVLLCITIIGIPFGVANFRLAGLALAPFGKVVIPRSQLPAGVTPVFGAPEPLGEPTAR
ncbi:MAG TPA: YccF domain-containing protein [Acidimicrobiales bacterium]|nr:YccF domain-containing protein [Acidimicrobiales bacterium]